VFDNMTSSLRDIPGADRPRPGRRRRDDPWQALPRGRQAPLLLDPGAGLGRPPRRRVRRSARRTPRLSGPDLLLLLGALAVAAFLGRAMWHATRVDVEVTGLRDDESLTLGDAKELNVAITVSPRHRLAAATLELDGKAIEAQKLQGGYRWSPAGSLTPGPHELRLQVPRPILGESTFRWSFLVDPDPPRLDAPRIVRAATMRDPVHVRGTVEDGADLTANGRPVDVDDHGRFELDYDRPPAGPIRLRAKDAAGQTTEVNVFVPVKRPVVKGVHLSGVAWADPVRRKAVMDMVEAGTIDTVQLDLKDEAGEVVYDSKVPLARRIGAIKRYYHLADAVRQLHAKGVRVVGRVVAFRDPILATAAWKDPDLHDWVLQDAAGKPQGAYGGFTNFAAAGVRRYNLDIALEGVDAGVDEILWDYIRRPEGDIANMRFPGLQKQPELAVVDFLATAQRALRARGVYQGASVFGVAANEGLSIAQDVPEMAKHLDYLSPMVYPSLWKAWQYSVPDPARQPALIVERSLARFQSLAAPMGIPITPWLQDFSLDGVTYGDNEVRAQIDASKSLEIPGFLLWNPRAVYHAGAFNG
jgi:hypothetical protein